MNDPITSHVAFKPSTLLKDDPDIVKCLFVVGRKLGTVVVSTQ